MPVVSYVLPLALLFSMLLSMEAGRRVRLRRGGDAGEGGAGALDAAVYGLFGLLLAFIFSGATQRFEHRRDLVLQETNAIGTAYLRIDLLPVEAQGPLRALFAAYVESRLHYYRVYGSSNEAQRQAAWQQSMALQNDIWKRATQAARDGGQAATITLVVSSLNEMIDITTTRLAATRLHPHPVIYAMLLLVGNAAAFLAGLSIAHVQRRPWPHILAFTLTIAGTVYVIMDIEYPRRGWVQIESSDLLLRELLQTMTSGVIN